MALTLRWTGRNEAEQVAWVRLQCYGGGTVDLKTAHNGVMADTDAFNKKVKLVWMGLGTAEPKNIYTGVMNYHNSLTAAGIKHDFYMSQGTAHEWQTWRRDLKEFAPLLFQ